jgi:hypothetical protein
MIMYLISSSKICLNKVRSADEKQEYVQYPVPVSSTEDPSVRPVSISNSLHVSSSQSRSFSIPLYEFKKLPCIQTI